MKKRLLALLLTFCLVAALLPATVLAAEDAKTYLALGDSITTGYAPGNKTVETPFANQVAEKNGYTLVNKAQNGETTASLLQKLDAKEIDVAGADLITISIGGNDLLQALAEAAAAASTAAGTETTAEQVLAMLAGGAVDAAAFQSMVTALSGLTASKAVTDALANAAKNLGTILTSLKSANPTAQVILLNQYNPYGQIDNALVAALVDAADLAVKALNTSLAVVAKAAGVTVADVYSAFDAVEETPCNAFFTDTTAFDIDVHPNQTGHDLIAAALNDLLAQSGEEEEETSSAVFTDVQPADWYYEAVTFAYAQGLMSGVGNKTFDPNGSVTRAMVWTVLARIAGEKISGADWAETAKTWAKAAGVSDGTNPMNPVTRQELATMLYRFAGSPEVTGDLSAYSDAAAVADWAETALVWATSTGLINGISGGLSPASGASRAQLATMLMRQLQQTQA